LWWEDTLPNVLEHVLIISARIHPARVGGALAKTQKAQRFWGWDRHSGQAEPQ
jgi:hypothetical protein